MYGLWIFAIRKEKLNKTKPKFMVYRMMEIQAKKSETIQDIATVIGQQTQKKTYVIQQKSK